MEEVDCVVVGAGVVGLAVARALAMAGREVIILEAAEGIGTETSSRNSEVIHAGIYYPANSLMARFCVAGRRQLYAYCAEKGVPHINCGKLIVATNAQEDAHAGRHQAARRGQRRRGHAGADRSRGDRAGAQPALHQRPAVARHRDHRQPQLSWSPCRATPKTPARLRCFSARCWAGGSPAAGSRSMSAAPTR